MDAVTSGEGDAPVSPKLKALLAIAGKVQQGGKQVTADDVARARAEGATDVEIHDTVLIAAAFCMYNRYVDGLATLTPTDPAAYDPMGKRMATQGYVGISQAQRQRASSHRAHIDTMPHITFPICRASAGRWPSGPRPPSRSTSWSTCCCAARTR